MHAVSDIHIAFAVDNGYAQHLGVAIVSLLHHLSPEARARLYVVGDGLDEANRALLEETVARYGASVTFRLAGGELRRQSVSSGHLSRSTYGKVLIPEWLADVPSDKLLYLDCDVVVLADVRELWETDLEGRAVGAVRDWGGGIHCKQLGIADSARYFNAGVLLIDLQRWRSESFTEKVLAYAGKNGGRLRFHDQDALNAVLHAEWLALDPKWNWQTNMLYRRRFRGKNRISPGIVHFTGSSKPWHFDNNHPYKPNYFEYLRMTEWRAYEPERKAGARMKKVIKRLLPRQAIGLAGRIKARIARGAADEVME